MGFLIDHYKGKYRLLAPYDISINQFPRKLNDTFEDIDIFIACQKGIKIFYYGKSILEVYVPSKTRGRNIVRDIKEELSDSIISYIEETDSELLFRFHSKHMERLEKYLCPKTNGSNISPFSVKNLPKNKDYNIPEDELVYYKNIVSNIPKKRILTITHITVLYLKSLVTKNNSWEDIQADMKLKGLKTKEYIHSIGKWNEYIKYLEENLSEN